MAQMKITISKSELLSKLSAVGKIIQAKNQLPAYNNFLFEVDEDGLLKVTAGEEGGRISTNIECQADFTSLSFMIDAKTILDGCREIPEQPLIMSIVDKKTYLEICVRYANGKFELVGGKADEFPILNLSGSEEPFTLNAQDFLYGIRQAQICSAHDELRPTMNGVFLDKDIDKITYVASDGSTLAMIEYTIQPDKRSSFILPERMSRVLSKIVPANCEEINVTVSEKNVIFEFDCFCLTCRMIEGRYPNYRSVIPQKNDKKATFVKSDLISALKRVAVFCNISSSLVVMNFEDEKLTLSGHDIDFSTSAEEEVAITYSGNPIKIGFKSSSLIELLSNIPGPEVSMTLLDPSRAALLRRSDEQENGLTYIIMPMTINC